MQFTVLILLLLSFGAFAQWSELLQVNEDEDTTLKRATIYLDQITRVSHYFWCQLDNKSGRFYLYYRRQIPRGILYPEIILDIEHSCEGVTVAGSSDGNKIFVAYGAEREMARTSCNQDMTSGCMDVYTLESFDGGVSWNRPVQLSRRNKNDVMTRWNPRILINPLTNRIWIFYLVKVPEEEVYKIGFISREESTRKYTDETIIVTRNEAIITAMPGISLSSGNARVHLIWSADVNKVLLMNHMISMNSGVSWNNMGTISRGFSGAVISNVIMNPDYMYLPYLLVQGSHAFIMMSTNGGSRWTGIDISSYSGLPDLTLCFKGFGTDGIVFSLLNAKVAEGKYIGEFGYLKVNTRAWIKKAKPFGDAILNYDPNIKCYVENDSYTVKAIAISKDTKLFVTKIIID